MAIERQRVLKRNEQQHPVAGMLDQAEATPAEAQADADNTSEANIADATATVHTLPAQTKPATTAPRSAPAKSARKAPAQPQPDLTPDAGKKQVNYRVDPTLIKDLKKASIIHSYRMGDQISQNQIVEMAVREWLDRNGPWEM